jgi:hypothetical protein
MVIVDCEGRGEKMGAIKIEIKSFCGFDKMNKGRTNVSMTDIFPVIMD